MDWTPITSIFTVLAFYVAWAAFYIDRRYKLQAKREAKEDILQSINKELGLMGGWLGGDYDDINYTTLQDPWHAFHMVYGLVRNDSIKNAISMKSVSLLSENLLESLVAFNQKLGSFEQHVNRMIQFNTADPITATKSFYYYDRFFANLSRAKKWIEFEKLAKKLFTGKKLSQEQIHLIGSVRILKDLHIIGIGTEVNPTSLRFSYAVCLELIGVEIRGISSDVRFKQSRLFSILDFLVAFSFIALFIYLFSSLLGGGEILMNINISWYLIAFLLIFVVSVVLGLVKYGSVSSAYRESRWQIKFIEVWNDFINYLLVGLIGYFFILVRLPVLLKGGELGLGDFFLFVIFILGIFGHLCVVSKNITEGVETLLRKLLKD